MSAKTKNKGVKLYTESEMVDATLNGEEVKIPKKWIGTEYADGYVVGEAKKAADEPVVIPDGDPVEAWTAKELDAYAVREGVDLSKVANKKADKLAAILDAKTAPPAA